MATSNYRCKHCKGPVDSVGPGTNSQIMGVCHNEWCMNYGWITGVDEGEKAMSELWDMEHIIDGSSGDIELERIVLATMIEYLQLWKKKQASYGPHNIGSFGAAGCLIRANDKIQRLRRHYFLNKDVSLADESIEDTWKDLMGYAIMGLICHRKKWPGLE